MFADGSVILNSPLRPKPGKPQTLFEHSQTGRRQGEAPDGETFQGPAQSLAFFPEPVFHGNEDIPQMHLSIIDAAYPHEPKTRAATAFGAGFYDERSKLPRLLRSIDLIGGFDNLCNDDKQGRQELLVSPRCVRGVQLISGEMIADQFAADTMRHGIGLDVPDIAASILFRQRE